MNVDTHWHHAARDAVGEPLFAGVELGGTKVICTLGTGPANIVASKRIATRDPESTLGEIEQVLDEWIGAHAPVAALGIASFGPLELDPSSPAYGMITRTSKPGWSGTDVAGRLQRRYGLPLGVDTDVNGAALAEGRWGGARGLRSWAYVTIGTGVGAGIVIDNRTVRGLGHAEAGHMLVGRSDDFAGACPYHRDCVEGLVSGPAIAARTSLSGEEIPADHPVWRSVAATVGAMLHNLVMTAAPQRIFLGGGVIERRPELLAMIRHTLIEWLAGYAHGVEVAREGNRFVEAPMLGGMAGPLGALALASDASRAAAGIREDAGNEVS